MKQRLERPNAVETQNRGLADTNKGSNTANQISSITNMDVTIDSSILSSQSQSPSNRLINSLVSKTKNDDDCLPLKDEAKFSGGTPTYLPDKALAKLDDQKDQNLHQERLPGRVDPSSVQQPSQTITTQVELVRISKDFKCSWKLRHTLGG
jgi:hypothetical protein